MVRTAGFCLIPRRAISEQFVISDIGNFLLKISDGRYRRPNFIIWSISYASTKTLEHKRSISSSRLYGKILLTRFLALSTQYMSSPSRKQGCVVSPRFHLVIFVFGVNQKKAGGVQDSQHQWWKASPQIFFQL